MTQHDYDIREVLTDICGIDSETGTAPGVTTQWEVVEATAEQVEIARGDYTVRLTQDGPRHGDLPFEAVRVTPAGDTYRLLQNDRLRPVWKAAEAFMLGFEEGYSAMSSHLA